MPRRIDVRQEIVEFVLGIKGIHTVLPATQDDDDMTMLICAQMLTDASLIYRTKPETKDIK